MPPIETYLLPGVTGKNQPSLQILFKTSEINTPLSALIIPLVIKLFLKNVPLPVVIPVT